MVQVLPYVPGFGEKLADAISQGVSGFGKGYLQQMENQRIQQVYKDLADPNISYLEKFAKTGQLPLENQKAIQQSLASILGPEAQAAANVREAKGLGIVTPTSPEVNGPNLPATPGAPQPTNQPLGTEIQPPINDQAAKQARRAELNSQIGLKGSKNPLIAAKGIEAEAELKNLDKEEDLARDRAKEARREEIEFHKESAKYDDDLIEKSKVAKKQIESFNDILDSIDSGNVTQKSAANLFKGFGKVGDKVAEWLENPDQAKFLTAIPQLLEGWKDVFGVRLTDADLKILQDKLPSLGKSPEANRAIVGVLRKYADQTILRSQIASEIKAGNGGLRPLGYADEIERRYDQALTPVEVINPNTGKKKTIPAYKVPDALKAGGRLSNE